MAFDMGFRGNGVGLGSTKGIARPRGGVLILIAVVVLLAICLVFLIVRLANNVELLTEVTETTATDTARLTTHPDTEGAEPIDVTGAVAVNPATNVGVKKDCPLVIPVSISSLSYQEGSLCESWKGYSQQSCSSAARELLLALEASGAQLVYSGYLDLSGETWGCSVKGEQDESLMLTLVPQHPGAARNEQNPLCMTIVHIKAPVPWSDPIKSQGPIADSLAEGQ